MLAIKHDRYGLLTLYVNNRAILGRTKPFGLFVGNLFIVFPVSPTGNRQFIVSLGYRVLLWWGGK